MIPRRRQRSLPPGILLEGRGSHLARGGQAKLVGQWGCGWEAWHVATTKLMPDKIAKIRSYPYTQVGKYQAQ